MKWTDEIDGEFNGNPCKIRVGYSESDYNKNLREQRVNNVVKDYGIWDRPKVGGVSENYSESAILKLTKMVLNINENNTVDFDINGDVLVELVNGLGE